MSSWRDDEIREILSVRASAKIIKLTEQQESAVYDQIMNRPQDCGVICVMSCLLYSPNVVFPVSNDTSDTDNLLLCPTCVKEKLWTMSALDSQNSYQSSYEKTALYTFNNSGTAAMEIHLTTCNNSNQPEQDQASGV